MAVRNLQKRRRTAGNRALAYRGKSGKNTRNDFFCLRVRGGSLSSKQKKGGGKAHEGHPSLKALRTPPPLRLVRFYTPQVSLL